MRILFIGGTGIISSACSKLALEEGHDVYLLQSTSPPGEAHLLELWFLADACRRAGDVPYAA